jgi:hypothetical protein
MPKRQGAGAVQDAGARFDGLSLFGGYGIFENALNRFFRLPALALRCKVTGMEPNLAAENLQTIRTLMERSAVYRRALAPIMLLTGILGVLAAVAGLHFKMESPRSFAGLWLGTAGMAVAGAFLLARRQAIRDQEPFWSPPARRVTQALLPPLLSGLFLGIVFARLDADWRVHVFMVVIWLLFYGCALNAAGFFMVRGIRWLGWIFILGAMALVCTQALTSHGIRPATGSLTMGFFFGGVHLAYGAYLYLTEKRKMAA